MTETNTAPWVITFAQGAARHAHCVRSEERDLERYPELRDALIWVNGRRYYILQKLEKHERKRAAAPPPPKRTAPKTNAKREATEAAEA